MKKLIFSSIFILSTLLLSITVFATPLPATSFTKLFNFNANITGMDTNGDYLYIVGKNDTSNFLMKYNYVTDEIYILKDNFLTVTCSGIARTAELTSIHYTNNGQLAISGLETAFGTGAGILIVNPTDFSIVANKFCVMGIYGGHPAQSLIDDSTGNIWFLSSAPSSSWTLQKYSSDLSLNFNNYTFPNTGGGAVDATNIVTDSSGNLIFFTGQNAGDASYHLSLHKWDQNFTQITNIDFGSVLSGYYPAGTIRKRALTIDTNDKLYTISTNYGSPASMDLFRWNETNVECSHTFTSGNGIYGTGAYYDPISNYLFGAGSYWYNPTARYDVFFSWSKADLDNCNFTSAGGYFGTTTASVSGYDLKKLDNGQFAFANWKYGESYTSGQSMGIDFWSLTGLCTCGSWTSYSCYNTTHRMQTRTCSPLHCAEEIQYISDPSCSSCACGSWSKVGCYNSTHSQWSRTCSPFHCDAELEFIVDGTCMCSCDFWNDAGCYNETHKTQIRTCSPTSCDVSIQYVSASECSGYIPIPAPVSTFFNKYMIATGIIIGISAGIAFWIGGEHTWLIFASILAILFFMLALAGFFPPWIIVLIAIIASVIFTKLVMGIFKRS